METNTERAKVTADTEIQSEWTEQDQGQQMNLEDETGLQVKHSETLNVSGAIWFLYIKSWSMISWTV